MEELLGVAFTGVGVAFTGVGVACSNKEEVLEVLGFLVGGIDEGMS